MGGGESKDACESGGTAFCGTVANSAGCIALSKEFYCTCQPGFQPEGRRMNSSCVDIDECARGIGLCFSKIENSECVNTPGSFECRCNEYRTLKNNVCEDINECLDNRGGCAEHTDCINNDGAAVTCRCLPGYTGNDGKPGRACKDINECEEPDHCPENSVCINTPGSYRCECKTGFAKDAEGMCTGKDFCVTGENGCDPNFATCTPVVGSYACACKDGFQGSGRKGECKPLPGSEYKACELLGLHCGRYQGCASDNAGSYRCAALTKVQQVKVLLSEGPGTETPLWLWCCVALAAVIFVGAVVYGVRYFLKKWKKTNESEDDALLSGYGYDYGAAHSFRG
ncbi:microneme protein MIC7 [Toxoplasma gondii TgCatPRC2]|uniref:Microneme protein MIC7 n=1 Tax=Toxoplasma gondii TgCatPRC2 TaxID=1130821 RepID=A0A151HMC1_TOXGO|nr:microneme protein MIC7 [Toxoplasma gondii TgCatPRC2]